MSSMMQLALASSGKDVHGACADPETGLYDIRKHMALRQQFCTVYITEGGKVIDCHPHYQICGGFSECLGQDLLLLDFFDLLLCFRHGQAWKHSYVEWCL